MEEENHRDHVLMLSFDVEDWFQVERLKPVIARDEWDRCELRVVENVEKLLAVLRRHNTKATFFILGWIAERLPDLVSRIQMEGHEIASHGYGHEVLYCLTEQEIKEDISRSKQILEEITGEQIIGYRAPRFSIVERLPNLLDKQGFQYDSSLFPCSFNNAYGDINIQKVPGNVSVGRLYNGLLEVPVSTLRFLGRMLPWGGGGYFRFSPYWLFKMGIRAFLKHQTGYVFYVHPWELDPGQPRVNGIPWVSKLFHYGFLSMTEEKLDRLVRDFRFVSIKEGLVKLELL